MSSIDHRRVHDYLIRENMTTLTLEESEQQVENFLHDPLDIQSIYRIFMINTQEALKKSLVPLAEKIFRLFKTHPVTRDNQYFIDLTQEAVIAKLQKKILPKYIPLLKDEAKIIGRTFEYSLLADRVKIMNCVFNFFQQHDYNPPRESWKVLFSDLTVIVKQIETRIPPAAVIESNLESSKLTEAKNKVLIEGAQKTHKYYLKKAQARD